METIPTLKVPAHAYDPERRMSSLLRSQVQLLQTAVTDAIDSEPEMVDCIRTLAELLRKLRPAITHVQALHDAVFDAIDTEAEAALCIRTYTRLLKQLRPQTEARAHHRRAAGTASKRAHKTTPKTTARARRKSGARHR